MLKKTLSVLLAVMMVVSVMTVGVVVSNAATTAGFEPDAGKVYFDIEGAVDTTGTSWADLMGTKGKVAFYFCGGDLDTEANPTKPIAWGGKKAIGTATAGETGVFEFDPAAKLGTLTDGVQYKLIFVRVDGSNWKDQTYDLFFTTDCLGHVAHCDGTFTENPVDSSKKTATAYWDDAIDPSENGPVKGITSIGNVVGSCNEQGKTDYDILVDFFSEEKTDFSGKTGYQNAHEYVCEIAETAPNYKSEQKLIDDIGAGLNLTKDDVKKALEDEAVKAKLADGPDCSWSYEDSTLPGGSTPHEHTPGDPTEENVVPATCQHAGSYDKVVYCTTCGEELSREEIVIGKLLHTPGEPAQENFVPATCKQAGGYDMVTYCTECGEEISREHTDIGKLLHTPGEPVQENVVPATCQHAGSYDKVTYCTECGDELTREEVVIGKLLHTPGEAVKENEKPATCTEKGGYDMVTYCTECGDELTREHTDIDMVPHTIHFVDKVDPVGTTPGMKEHYECEICHACFTDAEGQNEVDPSTLVIEPDHVRGDANGDGVFDEIDVTVLQRYLVELPVTDNFDGIAADADQDGVIDVIDVTLMQRVLARMTTWEKWDEKHPRIAIR